MPVLSIDFIMKHDRVKEVGDLNDLLWSDPDETSGFHRNPRGAGYLFGENVLQSFLDDHDLFCVFRSHQLVNNGYKSYFNGKLYTVWGAPNYCYSSGNIANVLAIDKDNHDFRLFYRCEEQFKETPMIYGFFDE